MFSVGKLIDAAIAPFAPALATRRAVARRAFERLSTYGAAKQDRTNKDWRTQNVSADAAILPDLPTITARARQLRRDNSEVASIVRAFGRNVVRTGITCKPAAKDKAGSLLTDFNSEIGDKFWDWANNPKLCDQEQRRTFWDIQRTAIEQVVEAGTCFVVQRYERRRNAPGLRLQLFEPEQLDTTRVRNPDTNAEIRGGVEVDAFGAAIAYWFYERHPGDLQPLPSKSSYQSRRVNADDVCVVMRPDRARQTLGVSWLAPVMNRLRKLERCDDATLETMELEADIALIITRNAGSGGPSTINGGAGESTTDSNGNRLSQFQKGMIFEGEDGETVQSVVKNTPGGQYLPFAMAQLRRAAAGVGIDYETTARDFSTANYSSLRQALLESRAEYEIAQQMIVNHLCRPVFAQFVEWAVLEGAVRGVSIADFYAARERMTYATWHPPKWTWVDPEKEVNAIEKAIGLRITSREQAISDMGGDARETFEQIRSGMNLAEEFGVTLPDDAPNERLRNDLDTYGVAVRAGVITPNAKDEDHWRAELGLPETPPEVTKSWTSRGGVVQPVTIQPDASSQPQPAGANN